jgi:hypothetical protein
MGEPGRNHGVYVIRLSDDVLGRPKFRKANPNYRPGMACLYVGCTGLSFEERFRRHKDGVQSNPYARDFGIKLVPELYAQYERRMWGQAKDLEKSLAEQLRAQGYAVWQR